MYKGPHLLSVNLEDYFQVAPMRQLIPHAHWSRFGLRAEKSTLETLDLLDKHGHKATFFVLGWLAERCPDLIAELNRRGHRVASKGYHHHRFNQFSLEEFEYDAKRSKDVIEAATGQEVQGYRIAEGSLPVSDLRPFEILAKAGFKYDSSVRPFGFGRKSNDAWNEITTIEKDNWSITEVPLSAYTFAGLSMPVTGGNYLRQIPDSIYRRLLNAYLRKTSTPWHLYFHVWELDTEQPRVSATTRLGHIRQYRNLENMRERLEELLTNYEFTTIENHLDLAPHAITRRAPSPAEENSVAAAAKAARQADRKNVTLVVPCYNEEETLPYLDSVLNSFATQNADTLNLSYVFVDDGSKDRTYEKLHEIFGTRSECTIIKHPHNRGIAAATMTGIRNAKDDIVCGIDCDCSFDPHELAKMIPLLEPGIDMVQASPYHPKGGVMNVPSWRLVLSRNLSRIYGHILNHRFASYTACFRVYRRSAVAQLDLSNGGFMGIMEIFVLLDRAGSKIVEYPAILETRLMGVSKMKTLSVIRNHLGMIAELIFTPGKITKRARRDAVNTAQEPT